MSYIIFAYTYVKYVQCIINFTILFCLQILYNYNIISDYFISDFEKAISLKPNYAEAYSNMGNTLKDQVKLDEAIETYNKAKLLKPNDPDVYYNLANTFQELGRWTTSSLKTDFIISGEWNGKAWVSSDNRDATVTIRYTLIQNEESIQQFEFTGDVNYGESAQLAGSADFPLTSLDDSPLTLLVESSWSGRGPPPPLTLSLIHISEPTRPY